MKKTISVAISTKNRSGFLETCLNSLLKQTVLPTEIVIINNNSTDNTQEVIDKYSKKIKIVTKMVEESNFPLLYNSAIMLAKSGIIAFIDDDCLATNNWIENIIKSHNQFKNSVIQGSVISVPKNNIYSSIMGFHYKNWLKSHMNSSGNLEVIDTKNVSFPKKIIKNNLFLNSLKLGSHDIEMGKRMTKKNIPIIYVDNIKVNHKERTTFLGFISQHWRIAQSEAMANKYLAKNEKISIVFSKKNLIAGKRLTKMISLGVKNFQLKNISKLLLLYFSLLVIRLVGYGVGLIKVRFIALKRL